MVLHTHSPSWISTIAERLGFIFLVWVTSGLTSGCLKAFNGAYRVNTARSIQFTYCTVWVLLQGSFPVELLHHHYENCYHVLNSRKLSREKTFAIFELLWLLVKVFSTKFGHVASFGGTIMKVFPQKLYFPPICEVFLPWKFPAIQYWCIFPIETEVYRKRTPALLQIYQKVRRPWDFY